MNANELADKLKALDFWLPMEQRIIAQNSATMLRQQHAEIEALKAENKFFKDLMDDVEILRGEK